MLLSWTSPSHLCAYVLGQGVTQNVRKRLIHLKLAAEDDQETSRLLKFDKENGGQLDGTL